MSAVQPSPQNPVDYDPFAEGTLARVVPTTEPQREIWLADQLGPDASLAFNESARMHLRGALDVVALRTALQALLDRHDALRSSFGPDGETMCVLEAVTLEIDERDLCALDSQERMQLVELRLRLAVDTPFSLEHDRLFRAELLRLAPDEHVLILTAHHIVCDGWSWWVLVQELGTLYAKHSGAVDKELPVAESFADYALAQSTDPHPVLTEDERYWLSRFSGEVPVLELPGDRPRPVRRSFASLREDYELDRSLVEALRALGARHGYSLFATLLASFAGLMSRLSGQSQVVVGIPAAGQAIDGHDHLVGHCVNALPLLFDLDMQQPVTHALEQAQSTLLDAIDHQRYTFGTLLRKLKIGRDPSRLPLISVMFNIDQALEQQRHALPGLDLDFDTNPRSHENFELFVNAVQVEGGMRLECQYNTALFDGSTIRRWLGYWRTMLEAMVQDETQSFARLPLLAETERRQVLVKWNDTHFDLPQDLCVHELFEAQVEKTPQATAVRFEDQSLTYGELNARANRLAHHLRELGVRPDARVAICIERSPDLVVAVLATLKAGGAYVPLDPTYPSERLAYMLEDSGPTVAIVAGQTLATQDEQGTPPTFDVRGLGIPVLDLRAPSPAWQHHRQDNPHPAGIGLTPQHLAYLIYTSGSTGKPKGVMVEHAGVCNYLQWALRYYGSADAIVSSSLAFDATVTSLFTPLLCGRAIRMLPERQEIDGMLALLRRGEGCGLINMLIKITPAHLDLLGQRLLESGDRPNVGVFVVGGEALPPSTVQMWRQLQPGVRMVNEYGPTETVVGCVVHDIPEDFDATRPVPIGTPISNMRIFILDSQGQPVPIGVVGELCIAGVAVARGYLGRPELTAERFVPDGFSGKANARMYRTGDLGRWLPDGKIEYVGRNDFQVKIRGFRVELGEIEKTLESHATVAQAAVIAREFQPGDTRLVGYLVARPGARIDPDALTAHLRATLPEYMVPPHLVVLDALPLSANGKVERKALPAPEGNASAQGRIAPRNALEHDIAEAMAGVLGLPEVGVHDDFFALGGHSLLAAQLIARLNRQLDRSLSLRTMFDRPTVARLADLLADEANEGVKRPHEAIPRRADPTRAPMSLMQQRLWVLEQIDPGKITYNGPSAHRLRGPLDVDALERAFQELLRRQTSLRTRFVDHGDGAVQEICEDVGGSLLPIQDLSSLPPQAREAELRARIDPMIAMPFQLDRVPLFRAHLFKLDEQDHVLFFMTHHIVWDGWSFDLFYEEMAALYAAFSTGRPSPLPELEVDYGDFATWHLERMAAGELQQQLAHWKQHLEGELEPLQLPADFARPPQPSGHGSTEWVRFDRAMADSMRAIGKRADATLFMTLLTAYYVLLHRLTGQRDLVVGVPVRNRGTEALERIMGFFVNMLPLRLKIDPAMPFLDLVRAVRNTVVESFTYPDVPFEELVRELRVPRDMSRSPIYQALFSFQDVRQRPTDWGALRHERFPVFQPGIANDIGLWFVENAHGLVGGLTYSTDLLTADTAALFHHRFSALLEAVRDDPTMAVGDLDIFCASDRDQVQKWNATAARVPVEATLHALLGAQAARGPERVALRFGERSVTYAELDASSNRIAHMLRRRGVRNGDLVGVCLDRGPDLVAAMIGVLKAGAGYVPLDPAYPAARLHFIAEDAGLSLMIAEGELAAPLDLPRQRLLLLDDDRLEIDEARADEPPEDAATDAESVAYAIYTSGSTGQPKGVRIPHRAVLNFLASMRREPGLDEGDRLLAVTTTSFDIAVLELFLPLSVGAEVIMASREQAADGHALAVLLSASGATVMQATPSTWRMLIEAGWRGAPRLRVLVGGEPLAPELAAQLCAGCAEVWNMYGPTETTVWSTCCKVERRETGITIGRPIANTSVWVRDERGQPCPVGVPGEIWIGGDGVALGYHQRPELDAERFVPDPYSSRPGARLYRTGDRGRWRADGMLEHLGRLDFQVKVRGNRIELGEIEARVSADPAVASAVAVVREDRPGDVRLVVYAVARAAAQIDIAGLRARLKSVLPDYMVPQHIVALDAMPLLPNGKLDRKALPAPVVAGEESKVVVDETKDPRVRYLAALWTELLGTATGPDDNFFDLGGHSMLAVQMANRVARDTGARIRLVRLATQTLSQVAADLPENVAPVAGAPGRGLVHNVMRLFGIAAAEGKS